MPVLQRHPQLRYPLTSEGVTSLEHFTLAMLCKDLSQILAAKWVQASFACV